MTFYEWWDTLPSPSLPEYDDGQQRNVAKMAWETALRLRPEAARIAQLERELETCRAVTKLCCEKNKESPK